MNIVQFYDINATIKEIRFLSESGSSREKNEKSSTFGNRTAAAAATGGIYYDPVSPPGNLERYARALFNVNTTKHYGRKFVNFEQIHDNYR